MKCAIVAVICLALTGCNAEKPVETKIHDASNGVNFIIDHRSGPALSQPEDKLYLVGDGERKLIFEGYGGSKLSLLSLKRGVLLVAYCGGAIRSTVSFLAKGKSAGEVTAIKVQPIITSGILINGKSVCQG
ncbi:MAG: hypothetical protein K2X76_14340 [Sphingomonas sp.]|nr:hypothetical protein [Sphingomonas sp.]